MWNTAQNQQGPHQCVYCVCMLQGLQPPLTSTSFYFSWTTNIGFVEDFTSLRPSFKSHSLTYWETLFSHTQAFLQVNLIHSIMAENVITYLKSSSASPESLSSPSVGLKQQGHQHVNILVPFKQEHHSMGKTAKTAFKHLKHVHYYAFLRFNTCCLRPIRSWASEIPAQAKDVFSVSERSEALMAEVRIKMKWNTKHKHLHHDIMLLML